MHTFVYICVCVCVCAVYALGIPKAIAVHRQAQESIRHAQTFISGTAPAAVLVAAICIHDADIRAGERLERNAGRGGRFEG